MITLADSQVRETLLQRVRSLTPQTPRRWGKMTAHQMVCHLNDSFLSVTGRRSAGKSGGFFERSVVKWIALYAPMRWPQGVPTMPEVDQMQGGTPPADWERDRGELIRLIGWFASPEAAKVAHPMFGDLSQMQWMRWGYLHVDHHLRQFGS